MNPAQKRMSDDMSITFPGKDIVCKNCRYRKRGVLGYRNTYCDMYPEGKPSEILFKDQKCQFKIEEAS